MNPEHEDPILDACLAEILCGIRPPDLAPRILQAWATGPSLAPEPGQVAAPSFSGLLLTRPPEVAPPQLISADATAPEPPPILAGLKEALTDTAKTPVVACHRAASYGVGKRHSLRRILVAGAVCAA